MISKLGLLYARLMTVPARKQAIPGPGTIFDLFIVLYEFLQGILFMILYSSIVAMFF